MSGLDHAAAFSGNPGQCSVAEAGCEGPALPRAARPVLVAQSVKFLDLALETHLLPEQAKAPPGAGDAHRLHVSGCRRRSGRFIDGLGHILIRFHDQAAAFPAAISSTRIRAAPNGNNSSLRLPSARRTRQRKPPSSESETRVTQGSLSPARKRRGPGPMHRGARWVPALLPPGACGAVLGCCVHRVPP